MRKSILVMAAVLLALFSVTAQNSQPAQTARTDWRKINPVTPLTAASFARPPVTDWPWVRMNIPATADPAEIKAEVKQLHDSGIAGIEIGQGAYPNNEQLVALLTAANQHGLKVGLSHGPPKNPAGYSIDAEHARKSLFVGKTAVNAGATFQGAVPPPAQTQGSRSGFGLAPPRGANAPAAHAGPTGPPPNRGPQAKRATLVAVLAYRCTKMPCAPTGPIELDRASVVDLTATITGKNKDGYVGGTTAGELQWTAPATPANAQWMVIGVWARGVFAQPDPFSDEGYGEVFDTFTVTVNGTPVSIDQISAASDIGAYLKAGRNTLTVRVATTLNNRLSKLDEDVARRKIVQPYGLVGPVMLIPNVQATVWQR